MAEPEDKIVAELRFVVASESGAGGSSFTDMFHVGHHFPLYNPMEVSGYSKLSVGDDKDLYGIHMIDVNTTIAREETPIQQPYYFDTKIQEADGVFLLYDVTSADSFRHLEVAYQRIDASKWYLPRVNERFEGTYEFVLVGNKMDLVDTDPTKRQVNKDEATRWASDRAMPHFEVSSHNRREVIEAITKLIENIKWRRNLLAKHAAEDKEKEDEASAKSKVDDKPVPHQPTKTKSRLKDAVGKLKLGRGR